MSRSALQFGLRPCAHRIRPHEDSHESYGSRCPTIAEETRLIYGGVGYGGGIAGQRQLAGVGADRTRIKSGHEDERRDVNWQGDTRLFAAPVAGAASAC